MFSYQVDNEIQLAVPRPALDAPPLFALLEADRAGLTKYLPWVAQTRTAAAEEAALAEFDRHFGAAASANLVLWVSGQQAGMISLNGFYENASADIGYWLGRQFRGRGVMSRAVAGLCGLAFTDYAQNKLVIRAAVDNAASNAVAEHAGFHLDGTLRAGERLLDGYHDEHEWSLLKAEWAKPQRPA